MYTILVFISISSCFVGASAVTFFGDQDHDEDIHDEDIFDDDHYSNPEEPGSEIDYVQFAKDILRGFSDKGFDNSDKNEDGFLDGSEISDFMKTSVGAVIKVSPIRFIKRYDSNSDKLLNKDEVWELIQNKDHQYFEILPEVKRSNDHLLSRSSENSERETSDDGLVIRH